MERVILRLTVWNSCHLVTVFVDEIVVEVADICLAAELVAGFRVGNALDNSAAGRSGHHSVTEERRKRP